MAGSVIERDGYVSADVIAKHFGVQPNTIVQWARTGRIPSLKLSPRVVRFRLSAVMKALGAGDEVAGTASEREGAL